MRVNATLSIIGQPSYGLFARQQQPGAFVLRAGGSLLWREATAQHFSALGGHYDDAKEGLEFRLTNRRTLNRTCLPHSASEMEAHAHWNRAANGVLHAAGVPILRVWHSTATAWDAHVDFGDCTHFCQPGVPDRWAKALMVSLLAGGRTGTGDDKPRDPLDADGGTR